MKFNQIASFFKNFWATYSFQYNFYIKQSLYISKVQNENKKFYQNTNYRIINDNKN